jgi:hypothetical protein
LGEEAVDEIGSVHDEAEASARGARAGYHDSGNLLGEARALNALGDIHAQASRSETYCSNWEPVKPRRWPPLLIG